MFDYLFASNRNVKEAFKDQEVDEDDKMLNKEKNPLEDERMQKYSFEDDGMQKIKMEIEGKDDIVRKVFLY